MVSKIYLFTNRNIVVFDEKGRQINHLQEAINHSSARSAWAEQKALKEILPQHPLYHMVRWTENGDGFSTELTEFEFVSLLGHGQWYFETYTEPEYKKEIATTQQEQTKEEN